MNIHRCNAHRRAMSVRKLIAASAVLGALISVAGFCFKWRLELDWSAPLQADLLEDLAVQKRMARAERWKREAVEEMVAEADTERTELQNQLKETEGAILGAQEGERRAKTAERTAKEGKHKAQEALQEAQAARYKAFDEAKAARKEASMLKARLQELRRRFWNDTESAFSDDEAEQGAPQSQSSVNHLLENRKAANLGVTGKVPLHDSKQQVMANLRAHGLDPASAMFLATQDHPQNVRCTAAKFADAFLHWIVRNPVACRAREGQE